MKYDILIITNLVAVRKRYVIRVTDKSKLRDY